MNKRATGNASNVINLASEDTERAVGNLEDTKLAFSELIDLSDEEFMSLMKEQSIGYLKSFDNLMYNQYMILLEARQKLIDISRDRSFSEEEQHNLLTFYAGIEKLNKKSFLIKERVKSISKMPFK